MFLSCGMKWVKGKKTEEMVIQITPEELKQAEDISGEFHEITVEKAFDSKMMEIFQGLRRRGNIGANVCLYQDTHSRTQFCQSLASP